MRIKRAKATKDVTSGRGTSDGRITKSKREKEEKENETEKSTLSVLNEQKDRRRGGGEEDRAGG